MLDHIIKIINESVKPGTEAVVRRCSVNKGVLKHCAKFTGKLQCWNLFFNKVAVASAVVVNKRTISDEYITVEKKVHSQCFPAETEKEVVKFFNNFFINKRKQDMAYLLV